MRFEGLPGEFSQRNFGQVEIRFLDGTGRKVHFFASRLKWSRWVKVTLVDDECTEPLVRTLGEHFVKFGGVPLCAIFDQAKTVVVRWKPKGFIPASPFRIVVFFPSDQGSVDGTRINANHEALLDRVCQAQGPFSWMRILPLFGKIEDLLGTFVRTLRSTSFRNEARDALTIEEGFGAIEGLATGTEGSGYFGHGLLPLSMATQHLILGLHQVVGIEEVPLEKRLVPDSFWVWVQHAGCPQRCFLGIFI